MARLSQICLAIDMDPFRFDQEFFRTEPASRSKKTERVDTALQEGTEFLLDVRGKTSLVLHAGFGEEGFQMLGHELVENGLGGAMLGVFGRSGPSWHAHIRARGVPSEVGPISSLLGAAAAFVGGGTPNAPPLPRVIPLLNAPNGS